MTRTRSARVLLAAFGIAVLGITAACTPEQIAAVQAAQAEQNRDKFPNAVSPAGLERLRHCESRGNYGAVSGTGKYRGAYQFSRATWNSVASRHYHHLRGVDPAAASAWDQDRMARALWNDYGRGQWPVCGKRV